MKRIGIIMMCFATMAFASCSLFQSAASSDPAAQAAGQACGSAVQGLYQSYSANKTLDLASGNNLSNALALATAYTTLNQNKDNSAFRKAFTTGLIASSAGLITSSNAGTFVDKLLASSGLANVNASNIAKTATTVQTIVGLLQTLKQ